MRNQNDFFSCLGIKQLREKRQIILPINMWLYHTRKKGEFYEGGHYKKKKTNKKKTKKRGLSLAHILFQKTYTKTPDPCFSKLATTHKIKNTLSHVKKTPRTIFGHLASNQELKKKPIPKVSLSSRSKP
jgi:hypothetical protein